MDCISECRGCGVQERCGAKLDCYGDCGYIASPGYPAPLIDHFTNYRWWIQSTSQQYIVQLQFLTFDVPSAKEETVTGECLQSHVSVYQNEVEVTLIPSLIGRFCNSFQPPEFIISTMPILELEYGAVKEMPNMKGFLVKYRTIYTNVMNDTFVEKRGK